MKPRLKRATRPSENLFGLEIGKTEVITYKYSNLRRAGNIR